MRNYAPCPPCPHLGSHNAIGGTDIKKLGKAHSCVNCDHTGPNLWMCLQHNCHYIGCPEQINDHSTLHFKENKTHCVHLNLSSQRAWCYLCEREVIIAPDAKQSAQIEDPFTSSVYNDFNDGDSSDSNSSLGLVGLQNIANTCYMNSALQALSNVVPMTHYFLNCADLVQYTADQALHRSKAGLAKSYQNLMRDIWGRRSGGAGGAGGNGKSYLAPRGILYGIRSVHSMFRGFQQHDTQEFLRCFMDQLHEELKEARPVSPNSYNSQFDKEMFNSDDEGSSVCSSLSRSSSFCSETDYETCESGRSEKLSLHSTTAQIHAAPSVNAGASAGATATAATATTIEPQKPPMKHNSLSQSQPQSLMQSIISDIFDGKLLSSVQCLTCDRVSTREETFQDLSLPIPNRDYLNLIHQTHSVSAQSLNSIDSVSSRANDGWLSWMWNWLRSWIWGPSVTLHDCMASFFSADELKGDNMYSCEKCNKLRTGVKYSQIMDLPEVLCIHLKRFRHDLSYSSKISSHVHFPLENFDMRPYMHKECNSRVSLYNLVSVICHHGTVGGGHYTCYARNSLTSRWYEYDDQHVTEVAPETVENCQAYVLFYGKHNAHMELLRAEASDIAASNPVHTADIRFYIAREWLARFNSFAEPGPISNWTILCPHGGVLQSKVELLNQIAVPIAQPLWEFLHRKLGGGPAINMLFECEVCKREAEALARRQYYELAVFTKYNGMDAELETSGIYAISMAWLRKWQQFVRGLTHKEPGPITNTTIVMPNETPQNGATPLRTNVIRPGKSDYAQISAPLWHFLHGIYGGGPEIILRAPINDEIEIIDQDEYKGEDLAGRNPDLSDTESNIGTPQPMPSMSDAHTADEAESAAARMAAELHKDVQRIDLDGSRHLPPPPAPPLATAAPSTSCYPSVRETKHSRHFIVNGKRLKATVALRNSLRKKGSRSRNALKNADFFGPKGTYKNENSMDAALAQRLDCTHSHMDGIAEHCNCDAYSSSPPASEAGSSGQQSSQLKTTAFGIHNIAPASASAPSTATATATATTRHQGRRKGGKSKDTTNSSANKITLQKFTYLREPGESTETDA